MKRMVGMSSLIFMLSVWLVGAFLVGSTLVAQEAKGSAEAPEAEVEQAYTMRCVACHGADGNSQLPDMSFTDGVWKHGSSEEDIAKIITEGVPGTAMMPFEAQLSPEEIQALAKYVRQFDPKLRGAEKPKG
ncbi:MAG: c-type cytochrome [Luteitalea sp.]|nr:c-type cytochrome [Luteitalea sp.]